jgi:CHASE3 domain sensor protein
LSRRIAYCLAIVRIILAPVIILAIYYLFRMGRIVDRIVNIDAPAATLAQQASIQMLEARRAERNYLLLSDPAYLEANRKALSQLNQIFGSIQDLQPDERGTVRVALDQIGYYQKQFDAAVTSTGLRQVVTTERVRSVLKDYEKHLDSLVRDAEREPRTRLLDQLRSQVASFDTEITDTVQAGNPPLRHATLDLEGSSAQIIQVASGIEIRTWARVQLDHERARALIYGAEWVLTVLSMVTFVLSIWVSFVLPKEITKPLIALSRAVDDAAEGNYKTDFDFHGEGEVIQLANSVRNLILHSKEKV